MHASLALLADCSAWRGMGVMIGRLAGVFRVSYLKSVFHFLIGCFTFDSEIGSGEVCAKA